MSMTQTQIEQVAREKFPYRKNHNRDSYMQREGFIAGALHCQPEIDTLTARVAQLEADCEKYRKDIAEGAKREEIARKVIEEKRKEK